MKLQKVRYDCPNCLARVHYPPKKEKCPCCKKKIPLDEWEHFQEERIIKQKKPRPGEKQVIRLAALVSTLQTSPGSKLKKRILAEALENDPALIKWIYLTYDPQQRLGFKSADLPEKYEASSVENVRDIIKGRRNKQIGRKLAAARWAGICECMGEPFKGVLYGVIDGSLKIGLNLKGINSVLRKIGQKQIKERK